MITVILVDDHTVVRAGFKMLLSIDENINIIAEAERGEQALRLYADKQPDVMVMDISMAGIGGLEAMRRIVESDKLAKILVFSVHDEQVFIDRAMSAGAKGFISKSSAASELSNAIHTVAQGRIYLENPAPLNEYYAHKTNHQWIIQQFAPREFDVFVLLAKGQTAHKIASELSLGYKTIANYSTQIKKKLNVSSVAELAHIAVLYGIVNH